ncbi:MAG: hypothetical protein WCX28_09115 [Bacteriovoracaceae bacterium]|nr:hypothetical protein [Bacteroidota bacterium]
MKALTFAALLIAAFSGCLSDEPSTAMVPSNTTFAISPTDNQTDVSPSSPINLTFARLADKSIVEQNFRLMDGRAFLDSLCPISLNMNHSQMSMSSSMLDSMKMNHLDSLHSIKGTFYWNTDGKSCSFKPDSTLQPGMQHIIHIREGMIKMMETTMGLMGMVGQNGMGSGMGMILHFTTKNNTSGDGHDSHHP